MGLTNINSPDPRSNPGGGGRLRCRGAPAQRRAPGLRGPDSHSCSEGRRDSDPVQLPDTGPRLRPDRSLLSIPHPTEGSGGVGAQRSAGETESHMLHTAGTGSSLPRTARALEHSPVPAPAGDAEASGEALHGLPTVCTEQACLIPEPWSLGGLSWGEEALCSEPRWQLKVPYLYYGQSGVLPGGTEPWHRAIYEAEAPWALAASRRLLSGNPLSWRQKN